MNEQSTFLQQSVKCNTWTTKMHITSSLLINIKVSNFITLQLLCYNILHKKEAKKIEGYIFTTKF